jgi:2,5-diamino-6-(ribosylamino)-4(3H)-pyrimidinone 5'-phosphate reductase
MEKILRLLERLGKETAKGVPIIVEGKNDVYALQKLDVNGDFILAKTAGKSFLDTLSEVEKKEKQEVILLMDFDKRGKEWTKRLTQHLEKMRIKPNSFFWKELLSLLRREVKDIEGLATYVETLKKKCG